jgi:hypothetical protein
MRARNLLMLIGMLCCSACGSITGTNETKTVIATVRFIGIEGGFYALRGDDSVTYDPTNLAKSFQIDGLRVVSRLNVRSGAGSVHMVGPTVDVVDIRRLDAYTFASAP